MRYLLLSLTLAILLLILPVKVAGAVGDENDEMAAADSHFFRSPVAILWTYQGEGSSSYVLQLRHQLLGDPLLPTVFGDLGLIPTAVVGDVIYESNPAKQAGDVIWSRATMYYDELFGYEFVQGRAIYRDIELDSYLGAGLGFSPIDDAWLGGYYLGGDGFMLSGEAAYGVTNSLWLYATADYYIDTSEAEGKAGVRFQDNIWLSVQNRVDSYIYAIGISQPLS